jgi:hypothetical protein
VDCWLALVCNRSFHSNSLVERVSSSWFMFPWLRYPWPTAHPLLQRVQPEQVALRVHAQRHPAEGPNRELGALSRINQVDGRFASTCCYRFQLTSGSPGVSSVLFPCLPGLGAAAAAGELERGVRHHRARVDRLLLALATGASGGRFCFGIPLGSRSAGTKTSSKLVAMRLPLTRCLRRAEARLGLFRPGCSWVYRANHHC